MSIREWIAVLRGEGRLRLLPPMMPGAPHPRLIYAAPELQAELEQSWDLGQSTDRIGRLLANLDTYSTGGLVVVSTGVENTALFKHLDPRAEEVWEIRSRDPKPSIRVFGRFAEVDIFIATHMCTRGYLGGPGSREWRDEFERCKTEWSKLFSTFEPVTGPDVRAYISENVVDLRTIE